MAAKKRRSTRNKGEEQTETAAVVVEPIVEIKSEPEEYSSDQQAEKTEEGGDNSDDGQATYPSLDVLADVASATLRNEPESSKRRHTKRLAQISSAPDTVVFETLDLDQIAHLTDKQLVENFGEMTSNEMSRNYSYRCCLVSDSCSETFSSFGNENKARMKIRNHLLQHVKTLLRTYEGRLDKFNVETVASKHRREAAEKKRAKSAKVAASDFSVQLRKRKSSAGQSPKYKDEEEEELVALKPKKPKVFVKTKKDKKLPEPIENDDSFEDLEDETVTDEPGAEEIEDEGQQKTDFEVENPEDPEGAAIIASENSNERHLRVVQEAWLKKKGNKDHCYTNLFGKRRGIDSFVFEIKSDGKINEEIVSRTSGTSRKEKVLQQAESPCNTITVRVVTNDTEEEDNNEVTVEELHVPVVKLSRPPPVGAEEVIGEDAEDASVSTEDAQAPPRGATMRHRGAGDEEEGDTDEPRCQTAAEMKRAEASVNATLRSAMAEENEYQLENEQVIGTSLNKPYPPMPKTDRTLKGRILYDAQYVDEELNALKDVEASKDTADWERKLALQYIRELRFKKKQDGSSFLRCRICKNKTFTASATLMYHYRSHAGIKPFVCLICNTTFTRQHSLNYHMLIHNNQSRFTCKECGRKFRHPSHFKEHMRRHTGETPFSCIDCENSFKTRNTYKRHLKTRHGKLLTATGIQDLPEGADMLDVKREMRIEYDDPDESTEDPREYGVIYEVREADDAEVTQDEYTIQSEQLYLPDNFETEQVYLVSNTDEDGQAVLTLEGEQFTVDGVESQVECVTEETVVTEEIPTVTLKEEKHEQDNEEGNEEDGGEAAAQQETDPQPNNKLLEFCTQLVNAQVVSSK